MYQKMKKLLLCLLPLLAFGVFMSSCKKDEGEPETPPVTHGNFYAKIANVDWNADFSYATEVNGRLQIVGTTLKGTVLVFDLDDIKAKTYTINDKATSYVDFVDSTKVPSATYSSDVDGTKYTGYITITSNNPVTKSVTGTFHLVLKDDINEQLLTVENGTFTVPYLSSLTVDAFKSYDVFFGVYNDAGVNQLGLWYKNPVTGKLVPRFIGSIDAANIFSNSVYDGKNKIFYAIGDGLHIHGMNVNTGEPAGDQDFRLIAPITIDEVNYGVHQPYDTSARQALVDFSVEGGTVNSVVVDSLIVPVDAESSIGYDGVNLYIVPAESELYTLLRVNIITKEQTIITYPYHSKGLDYIGNNTFLTVIDSVKFGNTFVSHLLGEIKINFGQVELNVIDDLDMGTFVDGHMSTAFSKKKNTFFIAYSSTSLMRTQVRSYNTVFEKLESYSDVETAIEGIKTRE